jgi:hypothetical protein
MLPTFDPDATLRADGEAPTVGMEGRAAPPTLPPPSRRTAEGDLEAMLDRRGFEVIEELGRGGMGRVLRARERELDREVALKVTRAEIASHGDRDDFRREARNCARLRHPHIVPIYSIGELDDGSVFFAMERVEGKSLQEIVVPSPSASAGLPPVRPLDRQTVIRLGLELCEALASAHEVGLIHRDVKPANILIEQDGRARLTDFGIALLRGAGHDADGGPAIAGTPQFMAPEQLNGSEVGRRADLYGLGGVLLFALGGGPAQRSLAEVREAVCDPDRRRRQVRARVARVADAAGEELAVLLRRLLDPEPARRPAAAEDVARILQSVMMTASGAAESARRRRRRVAQRWAALAAVALVVALAGWRLFAGGGGGRPRERTEGAVVASTESLLTRQAELSFWFDAAPPDDPLRPIAEQWRREITRAIAEGDLSRAGEIAETAHLRIAGETIVAADRAVAADAVAAASLSAEQREALRAVAGRIRLHQAVEAVELEAQLPIAKAVLMRRLR